MRAEETDLWNCDPQLTGRVLEELKIQARPGSRVYDFQAASMLHVIVLCGIDWIIVIDMFLSA